MLPFRKRCGCSGVGGDFRSGARHVPGRPEQKRARGGRHHTLLQAEIPAPRAAHAATRAFRCRVSAARRRGRRACARTRLAPTFRAPGSLALVDAHHVAEELEGLVLGALEGVSTPHHLTVFKAAWARPQASVPCSCQRLRGARSAPANIPRRLSDQGAGCRGTLGRGCMKLARCNAIHEPMCLSNSGRLEAYPTAQGVCMKLARCNAIHGRHAQGYQRLLPARDRLPWHPRGGGVYETGTVQCNP